MLSASTIRRLEIAQRNHRIRKFIVREPDGDGLGDVVIERNDRSVLRTDDAGARALLYVLPKGRARVPPLKFVGLRS